jgi:molybdopterin-guanine dinucleotide biosynthesis protein A
MGGADKAFLQLAGKPLIGHVLDRLRPQVATVVISANGDPARFARFRCEVLADTVPQGPLSGILAALTRAHEIGATHVASVPVDTPFVPIDLVMRLAETAKPSAEGLALARAFDGVHPVCGLWPVTLAPALAAFLEAGHAKVTRFTDAHHPGLQLFADRQAFMNLNTPEDLAAAEALLKGRP